MVELYSRGGNVAPLTELDGTPIEPLGVPALTPDEINALIAFMEALTDERVLYRRAPFDHPQLFVPNGHPGDFTTTSDSDGDGLADDLMIEIPAVGAAGGPPLPGFLDGVFGATGSAALINNRERKSERAGITSRRFLPQVTATSMLASQRASSSDTSMMATWTTLRHSLGRRDR